MERFPQISSKIHSRERENISNQTGGSQQSSTQKYRKRGYVGFVSQEGILGGYPLPSGRTKNSRPWKILGFDQILDRNHPCRRVHVSFVRELAGVSPPGRSTGLWQKPWKVLLKPRNDACRVCRDCDFGTF